MHHWREESDDEEERLSEKYGDLGGELLLVDLYLRPPCPTQLNNGINSPLGGGLGLFLTGNRDLNQMSVFICGVRPDSIVGRDGRLKVGDQLLEINGHVLYGRSHLNASPIISSCKSDVMQIVIHRDSKNMESMASRAPPSSLDINNSAKDTYSDSRKSSITSPVCSPRDGGGGGESRGSVRSHSGSYRSSSLRGSRRNGQTSGDASGIQGNYPLHFEIHRIILQAKDNDFGLTVRQEGSKDKTKIFIDSIEPTGAAAESGVIQKDDRLLQLDCSSVSGLTTEEVVERLASCKDGSVTMVIGRKLGTRCNAENPETTDVPDVNAPTAVEEDDTIGPEITPAANMRRIGKSQSVRTGTSDDHTISSNRRSWHRPAPPRPASAIDSATLGADKREICPGVETEIEFEKGSTGLGLSVVGGRDTFLSCIMVHEVYEGGAAERDGRLWSGDQILEVNGVDFSQVTHEEALAALRRPVSLVRMRVLREMSPMLEEDIYQLIETELVKRPNRGLGVSIVGRSGGDSGVFVLDLVKGGTAEADGKLKPGDQILEINNIDVRTSSQEKVATILKTAMGKVRLKVGRIQMSGSDSSSCRDASPQILPEKKKKKRDVFGHFRSKKPAV